MTCAICGETMSPTRISERLTSYRCRCSHRQASHAESDRERANDVDYHAQYDDSEFLVALRATRVRQSEEICAALETSCGPEKLRLLDFGSGRGWFLEACKKRGIADLGGADTSNLAIRALETTGIHGVLLDDFESIGIRKSLEKIRAELPYSPNAVTVLDVLEHFEGGGINVLLAEIAATFKSNLRILAVKVPVSNGILFRAATLLSALGLKGPLEQLFQTGTFPPHFHYFSKASARTALRSAGYEVIGEIGDPDFEAKFFSSRVHLLSKLPSPLGRLVGAAAFWISKVTGLCDSRVFLARPRR